MADYSTKKLVELQVEARSRSIKVSGRKKELIERLMFYDRNVSQEPVEPEFHMKLPDYGTYKDLHSGVPQIPNFTMTRLHEYLALFGKAFDDKCKEMYESRWLRFLRFSCTQDLFFLSSVMWAEMTKTATYKIDVSMDSNAVIQEAQCECGGGQGPTGHCKHIATVGYAFSQFCSGGNLLCEVTCTQVLQTFHRAKPHKGSPVKSADLLQIMKLERNVCFDPRPLWLRNRPEYPDQFRNLCINYQGAANMPVKQLFSSANVPALAHDHCYQAISMEDDFLIKWRVAEISEDEIKEIEEATRGQAHSIRWQEERLKRITSSHFGEICKATERRDKSKLASSYLVEKSLNTAAIVHGRKYETVAIEKYETLTGIQTSTCGLFVSSKVPYLAASPDRVIDEQNIVEVKCPFSAKDQEITSVSVPYLQTQDADFYLKTNHQYYYQIQGQLFCCGRSVCWLVVYTLKDLKVIKVEYDEAFVKSMLEVLQTFYNEHYKGALVEKHFYKNYYSRHLADN